MARSTVEVPEGMRQCIGSAKFLIAPHLAPIADFNPQPSQKDGLARMCRADWTRYTRSLREASTGKTIEPRSAKPERLPAGPPAKKDSPAPGSAAEKAADRAAQKALRDQLRGTSAKPARAEKIRTRPAKPAPIAEVEEPFEIAGPDALVDAAGQVEVLG